MSPFKANFFCVMPTVFVNGMKPTLFFLKIRGSCSDLTISFHNWYKTTRIKNCHPGRKTAKLHGNGNDFKGRACGIDFFPENIAKYFSLECKLRIIRNKFIVDENTTKVAWKNCSIASHSMSQKRQTSYQIAGQN